MVQPLVGRCSEPFAQRHAFSLCLTHEPVAILIGDHEWHSRCVERGVSVELVHHLSSQHVRQSWARGIVAPGATRGPRAGDRGVLCECAPWADKKRLDEVTNNSEIVGHTGQRAADQVRAPLIGPCRFGIELRRERLRKIRGDRGMASVKGRADRPCKPLTREGDVPGDGIDRLGIEHDSIIDNRHRANGTNGTSNTIPSSTTGTEQMARMAQRTLPCRESPRPVKSRSRVGR